MDSRQFRIEAQMSQFRLKSRYVLKEEIHRNLRKKVGIHLTYPIIEKSWKSDMYFATHGEIRKDSGVLPAPCLESFKS
jgi:hypothetical protein